MTGGAILCAREMSEEIWVVLRTDQPGWICRVCLGVWDRQGKAANATKGQLGLNDALAAGYREIVCPACRSKGENNGEEKPLCRAAKR